MFLEDGFAEALAELWSKRKNAKELHILPGQAVHESNQSPLSPIMFPVIQKPKRLPYLT
jgi:hypothetical protein